MEKKVQKILCWTRVKAGGQNEEEVGQDSGLVEDKSWSHIGSMIDKHGCLHDHCHAQKRTHKTLQYSNPTVLEIRTMGRLKFWTHLVWPSWF